MKHGCLLASACLLFSHTTVAAEASGYLVLTSDYVFRGVSYSDGDPAVQLGGELALENGLYAGVWASTTDISNGPGRQRDRELIYYVGVDREIGNHWSLGANLVAYTYPGQSGGFDYDYEEISLAVNYRDRAWLEFSYSPDLYHSGRAARNIDLFTEWPLPKQFVMGAGIGHYDPSDLTGAAYTYWQIGITRPLGIVDVDLRFHDTSAAVPIVSTPYRADARIALSLRLAF